MAQAPTESQGFFAVDYVGQIRNPKVNGVLVLMKQDEGPRVAGRLYTYEGDGVWLEIVSGGGGSNAITDPTGEAITDDIGTPITSLQGSGRVLTDTDEVTFDFTVSGEVGANVV